MQLAKSKELYHQRESEKRNTKILYGLLIWKLRTYFMAIVIKILEGSRTKTNHQPTTSNYQPIISKTGGQHQNHQPST